MCSSASLEQGESQKGQIRLFDKRVSLGHTLQGTSQRKSKAGATLELRRKLRYVQVIQWNLDKLIDIGDGEHELGSESGNLSQQ